MSEGLFQFKARTLSLAKVPVGKNEVIKDADLDRCVNDAVEEYSDWAPRLTSVQLDGDGPDFSLLEHIPDWKPGWEITKVMVDAAGVLTEVDPNSWRLYIRGESHHLVTRLSNPWVEFYGGHRLASSASQTTIPRRDLDPVARMAAAMVLETYAAECSDKTSSTINAATVDFSAEAGNLLKMADRYRADFDKKMTARHGGNYGIADHDHELPSGPPFYHGGARF